LNQRARVTFRGRVQGVNFRANTQEKAQMAGLKGWVKNMPNGCVEALFEGDEGAIRRIIQEIEHGHGMGNARVEDMEVRWVIYTGEYWEFNII
jgi:acylphosphatase